MKKLLLFAIICCRALFIYGQNTEILTIQNDSANIKLESLSIEVEIIGNMATTTTHMTFYNPSNRDLEGELKFPLAEGQSVCRFAMDVNGKLREGVAVEKKLGSRAFEGVVRQAIDPGLLEMTKGNNYKARVYPIPALDRKSIIVGYEEELSDTETPFYQMVMDYGEVDKFSLKVSVLLQEVKPSFRQNDITNFEFERLQNSFIARHSARNFNASGTISFALPIEQKERILRQKTNQQDIFYISLLPEYIERTKTPPNSIAILWDASKSGLYRDAQKDLELLEGYMKQIKDVDAKVLRFSNKVIDTAVFKIKKGNTDQLQRHLQSTQYDGGTNLAAFDFDQLHVDEVFLFSDGLSNLGDLSMEIPEAPINTITSSKSSNHTALQYVSEISGGDFIDLLSTPIQDALTSLFTENYQFLYATYNEHQISEVYPNRPVSIKPNTSFSLAGLITTGQEPPITLHFGIAGEVLFSRKIKLSKKMETPSLRRLWAKKKVQSLMSQPEDNKLAITQVGKTHSIVTPFTALIVLDRVEDYVRYEIEPPGELMDSYLKLMDQKEEKQAYQKEEIMELVLEEFEDRTDWWSLDLKDTAIYVPEKKDTSRSTVQIQEVETAEDVLEESLTEEDDDTEQYEQARHYLDSLILNQPFVDTTIFNKIIRGVVKDPAGDPLPGVNVVIKGTISGTVTDIEGRYLLRVRENDELIFNYVGYAGHEQAINGSDNMEIILTEDIAQLSEVVVTAYGVQTRSSVTGSESTVTESLAGRAPGVYVESGDDNTVVVRGNNTVEVGSRPLYVLDGEIVDEEEFNWLSQDEIASMNVIKDEAATSIYGSRASDGVIVIMTKSGLEDEIELPDSITSKFEKDLVIDEWTPDEPYIDSLEQISEGQLYAKYLDLRSEYGQAPSFYLACGDYFIAKGQRDIGIRILSNMVELEVENHELLKILAHRYRQLGDTETSILLFKRISQIREFEPHPKRDLALAYAANGDYQKALDTFYEILETDWRDAEDRFPLFKSTVLHEMNNLIALHKNDLDLSGLEEAFITTLPVDLRIVLDWNTLETDLDLWVTEPTGEKCFYDNPLTVLGGRLTEDYMDGYGPEEYLLKHAVPGDYKIEVDFYDERTQKISGPVILQVSVFKNYGTKSQSVKEYTLKLEGEEDTVQVGKIIWK